MIGTVLFSPLLPWPVIAVLAVLTLGFVVFAFWRGLTGWALRGMAGVVVLAALCGPLYQQEDRAPLSDIVLVVEDRSASQKLGARDAQTSAAIDNLTSTLAARENTEMRLLTVNDGPDDGGTLLMDTIVEALADEPLSRIAGVIAVSDGRIHDATRAPNLPAPLHLLQTGEATDWDRRLVVTGAPAFAIIGEPVTLKLKIEDQGAAPDATLARLQISVDGAPPQTFQMPIGQEFNLPVTLPHGGRNVIEFTVPEEAGELTARNNTALIQINGVRDRLRVLLVSGEPHAGGRTWRNLLKSDSSVDLVHFTILRPPEKQDGVPVGELSLIAFPTRELFLEKIDDFDLIIFDRYKRRGILPAIYLENVANYIAKGGAVLVAAGPDFAGASSLFRSPLGRVLPAEPTARVIEEPFLPTVTELGERHPVTENLPGRGDWGRWLRQIDLTTRSGHTVMSGDGDRPLLVLDRVEEGRVALLASDHAWLWSRGHEGGGPQLELLRRLAHWMMGEPELEEEALTANATGQSMRITRRTMSDDIGTVTVTAPDGTRTEVEMTQTRPGLYEGNFDGPEIGLYRLEDGELESVIGLGPAAPREFVETIATADVMQPAVDVLRGGALRLEEGMPRLREVRMGRPAAGRGWIGITPRNAYQTLDVRQMFLLPPWLVLLLSAGFITAGWLREGRR
ncbi:hypothetical protein E4Z66_17850 [Aliishimia ponticola]|uniref:Glutamine amidotransferase domain-containing protein n=1 Tax=Aliishimia ponticola TaxID=2499833 RepID=A0A4S4N6Q5_9RHOB|nr:hypothetical protein [Aliishimia ponticola]THH34824.1 hypothetical protein E4Z66_17850 [Aliishimia ponticola]